MELPKPIDTVVIGAGHAGLIMSHHLHAAGRGANEPHLERGPSDLRGSRRGCREAHAERAGDDRRGGCRIHRMCAWDSV